MLSTNATVINENNHEEILFLYHRQTLVENTLNETEFAGISSCGVLLFNIHDEFVQIKFWFTLANIRLAGLYESHVQLNSFLEQPPS